MKTNKTEIETEFIRATDELRKLIELATEFTTEEKAKCQTSPNRRTGGYDDCSTVRRADPFDADEAYDDIPRKDAVRCTRAEKLLVGLHEIAGLVRRARAELVNRDLTGCAITLGRVADAIDRELNK